MKLYKEEKVNPAAGCLPILLQIPIFYALYKVLMVSVEMRHKPFALWIQDLSAPDPLTPVNLFGYLDFTPPHMLAIGVLPILLGITMWLQMRLNPQVPDPVQRQIFALMPWILMFVMATFAAGLQLYWVTNNILTIAQQKWLYSRNPEMKNPPAAAPPPPPPPPPPAGARKGRMPRPSERGRSRTGRGGPEALFRAGLVPEVGAASCKFLPDPGVPEIAFAGRSNVGKSSLLNRLTNRSGLARTSNTPGRTQELNIFEVGEPVRLRLVDMPGYGFAKAPKDVARKWRFLVNDYLRGRQVLKRTLLLIDSRHGLKDVDREVMKMLDDAAVSYRLVLTKADKIKASELDAVTRRDRGGGPQASRRPSRDHRHLEPRRASAWTACAPRC